MMKRLLALFFAALFAAGVTGCQRDTATSTSPTSPSPRVAARWSSS